MLYGQFNDSFPPLTDGVAQTALNYTKWLNRNHGMACAVTPLHSGADDSKYDFRVIRYPAVPLPKSGKYWLGMPRLSASIMYKLYDLPFDLVHAHSPFSAGTLALRVAKHRGIPIVATFHSKFAEDFAQRLNSEIAGKIVADWTVQFYSMADSVWAVNKGTANTLMEYGYRGDIMVMPNGCDMPKSYRQGNEKKQILEKYALAEGPLLLFVGRLCQQKNPDMLLEAAYELKKADKQFSLLYVGDGELMEKLRKMTEKLELRGRVAFTGKILDREKLKEIYLASDLFILPSTYDNAPLVVREAAACGLPSLLIEDSNSAEGVTNNVNGFTARLEKNSLVKRLTELLERSDVLQGVGEMARKSIYVSWEEIVAKAAGEYDRLIRNNTKHKLDEYSMPKINAAINKIHHIITDRQSL